jgi:hypothetical protein
MQTDLVAGQRWIEEQIQRLAVEWEFTVTLRKWEALAASDDRRIVTLTLDLENQSIVENFTQDNLFRIRKDRRLRAKIEHRLKALFKSCGLIPDPNEEDDVIDDADQRDKGIEFRYSITSYGADYPVDGLIKRLKADDIFIPPFQRRYVWKRSQASRFVESLLLGLPVPAIFLGKEEETNRLLVIDGQQRLRSLWHFYRGSFENDEEFVLEDVASRFEGLSYATLHDADRRRLDDSILHAIVVRQDQPDEDRSSSIYLLFERLNTGGSLLHPQEIRACIYYGPFNDLLDELNRDLSWRAIYGPENPRSKDKELILRFFALFYDLDKYERPMEGALNGYMARNRRLQRQSAEELSRTFLPTVGIISEALGGEAFRPIRAINAAVYDAVMVGVARRLQNGPPLTTDHLREIYSRLLNDDAFKQGYNYSTADQERLNARIKLASDYFKESC